MNFKELCENRYSVRTYLSDEVETEKVNYILECARLAPSASNNQPWMFFVIKDKLVQQKIQESYNREWFAKAPLYIVACKDSSQSWKRSNYDSWDHADIDVAITSEHICLAAIEQGLGTCWVCNFDPSILREALQIEEEHIQPVAIFPIGYIDKKNAKVPQKIRKGISEIVHWL